MTQKYLALDAADLVRNITALLAQYPELADDHELRANVIEGETNIDKIIERALAEKMEADIMVSGIEEMVKTLNERLERFGRRAEAMRSLIRGIMLTANIKSLPLPIATVSIQAGRQSVQITDEAAIPSQLTVTKVTPDKAAIAAQLKAGEAVPGAELVTGQPTLIVRTK